jgi:hypothetical protein
MCFSKRKTPSQWPFMGMISKSTTVMPITGKKELVVV